MVPFEGSFGQLGIRWLRMSRASGLQWPPPLSKTLSILHFCSVGWKLAFRNRILP